MASALKDPCGEKGMPVVSGSATCSGLRWVSECQGWGPTMEGVVPHMVGGSHRGLHRGGRLMRRENLPDEPKKKMLQAEGLIVGQNQCNKTSVGVYENNPDVRC